MSALSNIKRFIVASAFSGRNITNLNFCFCCTLSKNLKDDKRYIFFDNEVQNLLKKLTRPDLQKIFRVKKLGQSFESSNLKFVTNEELKMIQEETLRRAEEKLQMPPVLPSSKDIEEVIVKDEKLCGYSNSKFVFTDISYGKNDRSRIIVVREPDGTLRYATRDERSKCNEIYFPQEGRKLRMPQMFNDEYLKNVLERNEYEFVLDRACVQFEPDDPHFVRVTEATYDHIANTRRFVDLLSTRHYGPLVFYLVRIENISPLLVFYLETDRLEDIGWTIALHSKLHPEKRCSIEYKPGEELELLKCFISECCPNDSQLELAYKMYVDFASRPKSEALA